MKIFGTLARLEDFDAFYELKCEDNNIHWSGHKNAPDRDKLLKWYRENIANPDRYFLMFFTDETRNDFIGYHYLDVVGPEKDTIDTGTAVLRRHGGKGYGTAMIKFGLEYAREHLPFIQGFQGWIASDNVRSIPMVLSNGYVKTG
jgi:RimJ/RimL family protein N-acetyltransferase